MHRGFIYYYREGLKSSRKTIYRNRCFFRYILYFLAEFFGRILIFFNPHFNIANIRQGYLIRKSNQFNFSSSFRNVGHRVSFGTYVLTLCLEGLILIAGIIAIALLAAILGSIGYGVSKIASYENYRLFILMFAAPSVPVLVLYVVVNLLIFSPTAYIIANNNGISAGETIGACYRTMINNGKMTVFLSYFISSLIKLLYLGALGVGGYFVIKLFIPEKYFVVSLIGLSVIALAGYITFAPILTLANRVVKEHLFEDIVLDPVTAARINEKVNLSVCNGKKLKAEAASRNLASLFEYTEDPYRIMAEREKKSDILAVNTPKSKKPSANVQEESEQTATEEPRVAMAEPEAASTFKPMSEFSAIPDVKPGSSAQPVNQQTN